MNQNGQKEVVIIAGANGSGKTTFARKFLDVTKYEFLNADDIAKEMNPEDPAQVRIAAGKALINRIHELVQAQNSFVIESTLSGSFLLKHIESFRTAGYEINLTFIYLGSTNLCAERIKTRVLQGGHDVPIEDIVRRYKRGLIRFWSEYRLVTDYFSIVFNHEQYDFKRVAHGKLSQIEIVDDGLYQEFLGQIKELNNGS